MGKNGHKLRPVDPSAPPAARVVSADRDRSHDEFRAATMVDLVFYLHVGGSGAIYDQTGLTGRYDFELDYEKFVDPSDPIRPRAQAAARLDAIRAQLGLDISEKKIRFENLVVVHAEKVPTAN